MICTMGYVQTVAWLQVHVLPKNNNNKNEKNAINAKRENGS